MLFFLTWFFQPVTDLVRSIRSSFPIDGSSVSHQINVPVTSAATTGDFEPVTSPKPRLICWVGEGRWYEVDRGRLDPGVVHNRLPVTLALSVDIWIGNFRAVCGLGNPGAENSAPGALG